MSLAEGEAGQAEFSGEAFGLDALDKFSPVIQDIQAMCRDTRLELSAVVHETGPAQIELNVAHGDAMSPSDHLFPPSARNFATT